MVFNNTSILAAITDSNDCAKKLENLIEHATTADLCLKDVIEILFTILHADNLPNQTKCNMIGQLLSMTLINTRLNNVEFYDKGVLLGRAAYIDLDIFKELLTHSCIAQILDVINDDSFIEYKCLIDTLLKKEAFDLLHDILLSIQPQDTRTFCDHIIASVEKNIIKDKPAEEISSLLLNSPSSLMTLLAHPAMLRRQQYSSPASLACFDAVCQIKCNEFIARHNNGRSIIECAQDLECCRYILLSFFSKWSLTHENCKNTQLLIEDPFVKAYLLHNPQSDPKKTYEKAQNLSLFLRLNHSQLDEYSYQKISLCLHHFLTELEQIPGVLFDSSASPSTAPRSLAWVTRIESSMRDLTPDEQRAFDHLQTSYKPMIDRLGGVGEVFEQMCRNLQQRYREDPAKVTLGDNQIIELPLTWEEFEDLRLEDHDKRKALEQYYQHPTHTTLRYFTIPNHFLSSSAGHADQTRKCAKFEDHQEYIVYSWVAANDTESSTQDESITIEDRVTEWIKDVSVNLARAHNMDKKQITREVNHKVVKIAVDDLEADNPSCELGDKRRIFNLLKWHPCTYVDFDLWLQEKLPAKIIAYMTEKFSLSRTEDLIALLEGYQQILEGNFSGNFTQFTQAWDITTPVLDRWADELVNDNCPTDCATIYSAMQKKLDKTIAGSHFLKFVHLYNLDELCRQELEKRRADVSVHIADHDKQVLDSGSVTTHALATGEPPVAPRSQPIYDSFPSARPRFSVINDELIHACWQSIPAHLHTHAWTRDNLQSVYKLCHMRLNKLTTPEDKTACLKLAFCLEMYNKSLCFAENPTKIHEFMDQAWLWFDKVQNFNPDNLKKELMAIAQEHFEANYKPFRILADFLMIIFFPIGLVVGAIKYSMTGSAFFYFKQNPTTQEQALEESLMPIAVQ